MSQKLIDAAYYILALMNAPILVMALAGDIPLQVYAIYWIGAYVATIAMAVFLQGMKGLSLLFCAVVSVIVVTLFGYGWAAIMASPNRKDA